MPFCSLCGVSFGKSEQVRAHIQGSKGKHEGIGYANAAEYISETPPDDDNAAGPASAPASAPADESLSSQAQGGLSIPERSVAPEQKDDQKDEPTCPECNGNTWFDASEHTNHDYGCADCSDGSSWQVFSE